MVARCPRGRLVAREVSRPLGATGKSFVLGRVAVRAPFFIKSLVDKVDRILFIIILLFLYC